MTKAMKYTDDADPVWARTALGTIRVSPAPDGETPVALDLEGRCPRCEDEMEYTHWLVTFRGFNELSRDDRLSAAAALRDTGVSLLPAEFTVRCACPATHPDPLGRKDLKGCGAMWKMRVEADS
jgi:hypothetical protein